MQPVYYDLPQHKIVFIATPKCATSSLMDALSPLLPEGVGVGLANPHHRWREMSIAPNEVKKIKSDRFIFSIARNPWARTLSHYNDKVFSSLHKRLQPYGFYAGMPFDEYLSILEKKISSINDAHVISQKKLMTYKNTYFPDYVMRFERLEKDWSALSYWLKERTGIQLEGLGHINSSKTRSAKSTAKYSAENAKVVRSIYGEDIDFFGYSQPPQKG